MPTAEKAELKSGRWITKWLTPIYQFEFLPPLLLLCNDSIGTWVLRAWVTAHMILTHVGWTTTSDKNILCFDIFYALINFKHVQSRVSTFSGTVVTNYELGGKHT